MGQALSRCRGRRGRRADTAAGEGRSLEGVPTGMMLLIFVNDFPVFL